ncbi:hypothetical protein APB26_32045 [Pseudomonas aeruginosa]|uniref:hypothetical protein n=1 Tax=Pseudomonas aeruginosa TaxID=287 RepID=UPI00071B27B2|nr:hypothetical protein [Pseudomonas aeruginosa]KSQ21618.1 hypothetical protein APB26_32045 [Pseudomonas aeruginosa]RPV61287.1 hypothetical protein IPC838_18375 [Pseudomonas aeruginosa]
MESTRDHLKGHASLAAMIRPYLDSWRAALVDSLMIKGDPDERSQLEEDIQALDDITLAVDSEMSGSDSGTALQAEIDELRALLNERVLNESRLKSFIANHGGFSIEMEGGAFAIMAEAFAKQLYESSASNYLELHFESDEYASLGQIVMTVKRETGKTPHMLRAEAEAERDALQKTNKVLLGALNPFAQFARILPPAPEGLNGALLKRETEGCAVQITAQDLDRALQVVNEVSARQ